MATHLLIAWAVAAALMGLLWICTRFGAKVSWVDVLWAFGVAITAASAGHFGTGNPSKRILITVLATLWGLRLGVVLWSRVQRSSEDGRYASWKDATGSSWPLISFLFLQAQALWIPLFAIPAAAAARSPSDPDLLTWIGTLVGLGSIAGEGIADRQLARFRSEPSNRGKVCRVGLWACSRHPNYFFEWLHWWAYVAIGVGSDLLWLTLAGPALMFVFLWKVTGIPATERQALKSRGEAYRRYQREVSAFLPWWPRRREES